MRKDYLPVDSSTGALDEAAFVERYWTSQWRDRTQPPDVAGVARQEEYRVIRDVLEQLPPGSRILDGGCGTGAWTVFLARRGFDVIGVDISHETVERLHEWFPGHQFRHADLRRTTFEAQSFDAYLSWGTFEHFECGLGECLSEAHRIVRPGGSLWVSVPFHNWRHMMNDSRPLERWDPGFDVSAGYAQQQRFYQWRLTRPELRRELELHGFHVHAIAPIGKLTGAGRLLQGHMPVFRKGSRAYAAASRTVALALPSFLLSHMIVAVAERR